MAHMKEPAGWDAVQNGAEVAENIGIGFTYAVLKMTDEEVELASLQTEVQGTIPREVFDRKYVVLEGLKKERVIEKKEVQIEASRAAFRNQMRNWKRKRGLKTKEEEEMAKNAAAKKTTGKGTAKKGAVKSTGAVAQVHAICDKNLKLAPSALIKKCVDAGINPGTARTQVNKWRRDKGLTKPPTAKKGAKGKKK